MKYGEIIFSSIVGTGLMVFYGILSHEFWLLVAGGFFSSGVFCALWWWDRRLKPSNCISIFHHDGIEILKQPNGDLDILVVGSCGVLPAKQIDHLLVALAAAKMK